MKKLCIAIATGCFSLSLAAGAIAGPVDLSGWSEKTLDFPGGQSSGNWIVAADNNSVTQTVNADPSFFLNNLNQTSYSMDGAWKVQTTSDNDFMGFVFGYQNSSNFYLFDWKQGSQNYAGASASEGMSIKKYEGTTGDGLNDLSLAEFWENDTDLGDMTILETNLGNDKGWEDNKEYKFHLDFNLIAGQFGITVKDENDSTLWDVTVNDSTFTNGQFGFYNYSQEQIKYSGFVQTGGQPGNPIPEPATMLLFGTGLASLAAITRKRKK